MSKKVKTPQSKYIPRIRFDISQYKFREVEEITRLKKQNKTSDKKLIARHKITIKKKETFLDRLTRSHGNISQACKFSGISRSTFNRWRDECLEFKRAYEDTEESAIDIAVSMLRRNILAGNTACLIFYLKCQAYKRGFSEKVTQVNPNDTEDQLTKKEIDRKLREVQKEIRTLSDDTGIDKLTVVTPIQKIA